MKLKFKTPKKPKNVASAIRRYIRSTGNEVSKSRCLEISAAMFGYRHWNELLASLDTEADSLPDGYVSQDEIRVRVHQYLHALHRFGFSDADAWALLEGTRSGRWLGKYVECARPVQQTGDSFTNAAA
jgi:hypothetical protein